ncbi:globin-coupled sensor protein [Natronorubrum texcoconense]|uniref:Methyl-accepting chemotaxis protein (MCP) signalling domain-containing protein n=1 Tax=Natronorubrum texcoconense TaxID=1095776 RepID=A0A1G9EYY1_9EURY|nr:globin-coupled sensor protein [Natronorubrum texcoconense]SDK81258.1 Methyl-accepting chemotaxis protein (MCP) signalling domain-containing protein [Natronorubrum texcoconense]
MNPEQSFGRGGLNGFLDADDLVDRIGLDADEIAWRKTYIGFDAEDERRLSDLETLLRENQHQIADDFYDNVLQYDETRAIVDRSPKGVDALKQTQRAYLVSLATGDYDRQFFANRARIGKLHELLDMPLKQYVGQYGVYYELLLERLDERVQQQVVDAIEAWAEERQDDGGLGGLVSALGFGDDGGETGLEESFEETVRAAVDDGMMDVLALLRLINLDMQIATETYVDSYAQRLEESIERRERLAAEVEADVQQPIEELHEASEAVATRAETISSHTATQATKTNRAATELGELSAAVEEVASVTDEVRRESDRTERLAAEGVEAADDALAELEAIEDATTAVSRSVADLEERTREIDAVVDRLDALAERTTVLAKNAKIEAARSDGQHTGSGTMGVIADEVESFAERTKRDLAAIETAVEGVRDDALETVETTEETVDRVDDGTDRVRETMASLEGIHESAETTAVRMEDVAAATDQQARNVEAAATTVEEIAGTADQVATAAESTAAASQEQTASLRNVGETVSRLTEEDGEDREPVYERLE